MMRFEPGEHVVAKLHGQLAHPVGLRVGNHADSLVVVRVSLLAEGVERGDALAAPIVNESESMTR